MPDKYDVPAEELTDSELIAAIIDDSRGYASVQHAERHVTDFRAGREGTACERGTCRFDRNLDDLIASAARHWRWLLAHDRPRAARLLRYARSRRETTAATAESDIAAMQASLMYPVATAP